MKPLRIGFLSTAGIGKKNWKAIFHSGNSIVSAVASRDVQKSREFIEECQREFRFEKEPRPLGSYEELLTSPEVDAIYFPLPTALRCELVIRAAQNGKHVLCEKPCASNAAELEKMVAACRQNNVQFMDGVMFMHSPRMKKIREVLDDGQTIGGIRRIASNFSFFGGDEFLRSNIRADGRLEPTGCLGDLGWYSIRFALWALNWQLPKGVSAKILSASENLPHRPSAPAEFSAELIFDKNVSFEFYSSFVTSRQQWVYISGEKGCLRVPDFIHPFNSYEPAFDINEKSVVVPGETKCPPGVDPYIQGHATAQDAYMWRNFANQIASGKLNEDWPMWSLKTQQVLDACFEAAQSQKRG